MSKTDDNDDNGPRESHEEKRTSPAVDIEGDAGPSDQDDFEDAVDSSSVRPLTKRSASTIKSTPSDHEESDENRSNHSDQGPAGEIAPDGETTPAEKEAETAPEHESTTQSKRASVSSNLENVDLNDDAPAPHERKESKDLNEKDLSEQQSKTLSLSSITNALPAMPWSPPADSSAMKSPNLSSAAMAPPPPAPNAQPPPSRKLTSPFSWLSRNSSGKDKDTMISPPTQASPRRNTASSIATLTSNPEMMLSRLEEENQNNSAESRSSLKDRFKLLRMQEEAGIPPPLLDDEKSGSAIASLARTHTAAMGLPSSSDDASGDKPPPSPAPASDSNLAPGTASGVTAGPSTMPEIEVDWDLWQSVVYEGPAAVARTSAEELNRAIASGIPSAIRGVIWQVLAQSKNEALEAVYEVLVAKGTDKEKNRHSNGTASSAGSNGQPAVRNGDGSSASSIHSDHSAANGVSSPKNEKSAETLTKAQAAAAATEKKKKAKEEAATLQKLEKTIKRDLGGRTSFSKYAASAGLQEGLFGVCKAYALYDDGVGYAQGMNFLIMPLLFNMPEQEAFCLLVRLMNHYNLRDLFVQDMPGLHMRLYQFERLLEDFEPALYCHLRRRGISPHLYATQWFLTLFAYRFPLQLVLRIYDLIFSEGLSAILRFGIVLMRKNADILLSISDMQQLTVHLKDKIFDVYIDKDPSQGSILENGFFGSSSSNIDKEVYRADQLVTDACEIKITPETLNLYTSEWEEKTRVERERETEIQELRAGNSNLSVRVRNLEQRVEVCDGEQAALATELVHTKVENQELKDENESLKGQVRELKVVIDKQPLEVEEKWSLERDSLMKRNQNVHEENEKLEKELADLEEQLVQTKMRYAEINDQHETLTRKWSDLKRQFA